MKRFLILLASIVLLSSGAIVAGTRRVPSQYATIQLAINAAALGDTVLLADGTYTGPGNRDIDYNGILVLIIRSESGDPNACIIDCEGSPSQPHRGFYFHSGERHYCALEGVTITGGYVLQGGGINFSNSSATIRNCIIRQNYAVDNGGGIYCNTSSPTIIDCVITQNSAENGGAGIYCVYGEPTISDNTISANLVTGNEGQDMGGGICCVYCTGQVTIDNNIIRENFAYAGGGINCFDADPGINNNTISDNLAYGGGGIGLCCGSTPMIMDNTINGNEAYDLGGGIFCNSSSNAFIHYNIISNNISSGAFSYGGAICCLESNPSIFSNIISKNSARSGGAISCRANSDASLGSNTIVANSGNYGGGIHSDYDSNPTVTRCIIAFSTQGVAVYCSGGSAIPALNCCDLFGNAGGDWVGCISGQYGVNGNFSENPILCYPENEEYTLHLQSPCLPGNHPDGNNCALIGALGPGCAYIATLLQSYRVTYEESAIRVQWTLTEIDEEITFEVLRTELPGTEYLTLATPLIERDGLKFTFFDRDIEQGKKYQYRVDVLDNTSGQVLFETEVVSTPALPLSLYQNHPNPFNPSTTIKYYLPKKSWVILDIYDVSGKRIARLVNGTKNKGFQTSEWDGRDARGNHVTSGTYFYRLTTGKETISKKMVLLR